MYLVIGLGNPEEQYAKTRHNMGFSTINKIAEKYHISFDKKKFDAIYTDTIIEGEKVILIKPQTYMNLSGNSVRQFVQFYKIPMDHVIVIYDDIDIEKGIIKIRKKGGPGNHNGMKSVVQEIGNDTFPRVRVGIGAPIYKNDMINYVIGQVPNEEYEILEKGIKVAAEAVIDILKNGIDHAMNEYN